MVTLDSSEQAGHNPFPGTTTGSLISFLVLSIPLGAVAFFVMYCNSVGGTFDLDSTVTITSTMKTALTIHAIYFVQVPGGLELVSLGRNMMGSLPAWVGITYPKYTGNLFWMTSYLAAELFFVCATLYILMLTRVSVPRWTLIVPLGQCAYNMKNDLMWVALGKLMSPEGKRITGFIADTLLIGGLFVVYINHFFTAPAIAPK